MIIDFFFYKNKSFILSILFSLSCFSVSVIAASIGGDDENDRGLVGLVPDDDDIGPDQLFLKFGLLVNNDEFQIYRSGKIGDGELKDLKEYLSEKGLNFPKTIIYMNSFGYKFPFYFALDEHELQRKYGYKYYHSFGSPRTYLDGYNPHAPSVDIDSKSILGHHARKRFSLRKDGIDGDIEDFYNILNLVLDPANQPVLFHCFGGRHRTGMIALAVRYLQGGWWVNGPTFKRNGLELNPAQFEYYRFNHLFFRKENLDFIERVSKEDRFLNLQQRFRGRLQGLDTGIGH